MNPEQTASYLSLVSFQFVNPTVMKAWRIPHLPYEELPPLADYDYADYLKARSFSELDPVIKSSNDKTAGQGVHRPRYLFWSFLRVFGMANGLF